MRRVSLFGAALLIMLIGFAGSVLMLGDQARLKQLLALHAEQQFGRELHIDGPVSVRFFPRLRVEAHDIRLSGPGASNGPDFLESGRMVAEIRMLPLVMGRVETSEVSITQARVNLLIDNQGEHNFGGLLRHRHRVGAPGVVADGPLRLENLELNVGLTETGSTTRLVVERVELDGLAFDRALQLVFRGAVGSPAVIEDVAMTGVLHVPAATGHFRLADMNLGGRMAGAELPFELTGTLDFSALAPFRMKLESGHWRFDGQAIALEGEYVGGPRPLYRLDASGDSLDGASLLGVVGQPRLAEWLEILSGWTAMHDYKLAFQVDSLALGDWPLANVSMAVDATNGLAAIEHARASLPGGYVELDGALAVEAESTLLTAQARIEIGDLSSLLSAAAVPLLADGAGQIVLEPVGESESAALVRGSLRFFDGWIAPLGVVRGALGRDERTDFGYVDGEFLVYSDHVEFSSLRIHRHDSWLELDGLTVGPGEQLSGEVVFRGQEVLQRRLRLGGHLNRPEFRAVPAEPAAQ